MNVRLKDFYKLVKDSITKMQRNISCYIIGCEEGKYYVGSTPDWRVQTRFKAHRNGTGSKWCQQFPGIRIVKLIENLTSAEGFNQENTECIRILIENNDLQCCRGGDILFPLGTVWWVNRYNALIEHFGTQVLTIS